MTIVELHVLITHFYITIWYFTGNCAAARIEFKIETIKEFLKSGPHKTPNQLWKKQHFLHSYERELTSQFYPLIQNLEKFVNPWFNFQNFFVTINNFHITYLKQFQVPILLRSFELTILSRKGVDGGRKIPKQFVWSPRNILFHNISWAYLYIELHLTNCPLSKYLLGVDNTFHSDEYCLRINRKFYQMNAKPWMCEVHFHFYPVALGSLSKGKSKLGPQLFKEIDASLMPAPFPPLVSNTYTYMSTWQIYLLHSAFNW